MAIRLWKGPSGTTSSPKSGGWNSSSNWSPSGVPVTGDDVVLGGTGTYTLTLNISATPNLHSLTVNDRRATLAIGNATLNVAGTSSTAINITAGHITIAGGKINDAGGMALASSSSSLSGWGSVAGSLSGNGTVTASGGTLEFSNAVDGSGTASSFQIANVAGSDLQFDSSVGTTGTISTTGIAPIVTFDGATGVLGLGSIGTFQGVIANFAPGDAIKVAGATSAALDSTGKVLSVFNGSTPLGTLTFTTSYTGDTFSVSNGAITVSTPAAPTVTADITVPGGSQAAVVATSSTSTSTPSNTTSVNLSPLTAATDAHNHWIGGPATVASLDAANIPSFGRILGGGSSDFDRDPHSPASLALLVDYMASAFADRSAGLMAAPMDDAATATTPQLLSTPHG